MISRWLGWGSRTSQALQYCNTCAFDEGCRHPDEARPSMGAWGIDVFGTAPKHRFTINVVKTYEDPRHYFGIFLVE